MHLGHRTCRLLQQPWQSTLALEVLEQRDAADPQMLIRIAGLAGQEPGLCPLLSWRVRATHHRFMAAP